MNYRNKLTLLALAAGLLVAACKPASEAAAPQAALEAASAPSDAPSAAETLATSAAIPFDSALPSDLQSPAAESGGECGIEATATVPQGAPLQFARTRKEYIEGWALVRGSEAKAESIYLKLASNGDASYFVPVKQVGREGLGIRLGEAGLDAAGFAVDAAFDNVPAGEYTVQVAQRVGGRVLLCATGRTATVSD